METVAMDLKQRYADFKAINPNVRIRNAANELGVSEAELLATSCGENVTRLDPDMEGILSRVEEMGYVMALTRNDDVVHERKGVYLNGSFGDFASLFVGEDIDLRIFLMHWKHAFAVTEITGDKPRYSIQFFSGWGEAMHKVYLTHKSDEDAYHKILADFKSDDQSTTIEVTEKPAAEVELPDAEIDVDEFREEWRNLKDTHNFFGMTKKYKVTRTQALRLAPQGDFTVQVDNAAVRTLLEKAVEHAVPIMVFVGNKGMIQIHTGEVKNLVDHGPWFNVLDPEFNMHLKMPSIAQSWVVRKPTEDGVVTSLELFNEKKELIVTFFGKRKPGIPEIQAWRDIVAETESERAL